MVVDQIENSEGPALVVTPSFALGDLAFGMGNAGIFAVIVEIS